MLYAVYLCFHKSFALLHYTFFIDYILTSGWLLIVKMQITKDTTAMQD